MFDPVGARACGCLVSSHAAEYEPRTSSAARVPATPPHE